MTSIGIDMVEIGRIESAVTQWGERFLGRVYTEAELESYQGRISSLASRFAGKEAVMKALGTGARGVAWREIEILSDAHGKPCVNLYGKAKERAESLKLGEFSISLSDTRQYAIAVVMGA